MLWVPVSVGVAFAGLAVLSVCAGKVFVAVRGLARELERARRRLEPKHAALRGELNELQSAPEPDTRRESVRSS